MRVSWDADELGRLSTDIVQAAIKTDADCRVVVKKNARSLRDLWRSNATKSAGKHGKLYPRTIKDHVSGLEAHIEPDVAMPQGGMAFEYGGPSVIRNPSPTGRGGAMGQPVGQLGPHLDGNRAADVVFPKFITDAGDAAEFEL